MPFQTEDIRPSGGMDKDTDLTLIKKGDYLDALNIQHITDGGGTSYAIQNTKGNLYRFAIPPTGVQNKSYRVLIQTVATTSRQVTFYKTDGSVMIAVTYADDPVFATAVTNFTTAVTAALGGVGQTAIYGINAENALYRDVTITTVMGYEWTLASTGADSTVVEIIQEAYDESLVNYYDSSHSRVNGAIIIGSYDLLGQLFIWSTTQENMPSTLLSTTGAAITLTASNVVGTKIRITTSSPTDLFTGLSVVISGCVGAGAASTNGTWIIDVISSTAFDLQNSTWASNTIGSDALVTINAEGVGEIGVAEYDANTSSFSYNTLLKSKELNFRSQKQIDTYCEQNNFQTSVYWTDDYNVPRVMYYRGAYVSDGAVAAINSEGLYAYGTIADEIKLILTNSDVGFTFLSQLVGGGTIESGNWRYSIRLMTSSFAATNWTELSNPINVYLADQTAAPQNICGDDALTVTSKINQFTVSGLILGLFSYVELAGINYVDGAIVGSVIKRVSITGTSLTIQHTGSEADVVSLDVASINQSSFNISTAKNIDAIDNRLILSNLTTPQDLDFSAWTETWTHSVKQHDITGVSSVLAPVFGEYQDPLNVFNYIGYMHNDTYRYSARVRLISSGELTKAYWIDDIRIDDSAANINPGRRVAGLPNMDLTTSTYGGRDVRVPYIEFSGIDLDYLIDGVPVRDLISEIHIERVERVPEVLMTGHIALAVTGYSEVLGTGSQVDYGGGANYGEYPFISGDMGSTGTIAYPGTNFTAYRKLAKLYSPDIFCGQASSPTYTAGDVFICFGQAGRVSNNGFRTAPNIYYSNYTEYHGYFNIAPVNITLTGVTAVAQPTGTATIGGVTYQTGLDGIAPVALFNQRGGSVLVSASNFTPVGPATDYGFYYGQYFREIAYTDPDSNKYGPRISSSYIPTGCIISISSSTASPTTADVFGGDVMIQKTWLKTRASDGTALAGGGGGGVGFYSENVVNSQMVKKYNSASSAWIFPRTTDTNWLEQTAGDLGDVLATYNSGYNIVNGVSVDVAYDNSLPDQSDLPTEIRWSDLKPQNSVVDNFRIFLPLNFKDLPLSWGEITHHTDFNGELFTFQPRMVQRQYFNTRGTMQVGGQTPTDVLIGDGAVMSRDGAMVTGIGTYHKWSVIKGKSAQGNDTLYWINTELKKVMRMGYDGTVSVADIHGMQSFFANNLTWVIGKDNPANEQGICGVWDDRYMSALWTVRGVRSYAAYVAGTTYAKGDVVSAGARYGNYSTYEELGEIYISLANSNTGNDPTSSDTYWYLVPHSGDFTVTYTDLTTATHNANEYYNQYTIEFNEQKNKFTTFYTFKPTIYLKWTDTFLTPKPIANRGLVYEHRLGGHCSWYSEQQEEDGYIEMIQNAGITASKSYLALWFGTEIVPERVDVYTKNHQSFMLGVDAETENNLDFFTMPVKNDILTSSTGALNDEDTSGLFGEYMKIKLTFAASVYQSIVDVVVKFFTQSRTSSK